MTCKVQTGNCRACRLSIGSLGFHADFSLKPAKNDIDFIPVMQCGIRPVLIGGEQTVTGRATAPAWRKSTRSSSNGCVEVAPMPDTILVRDSKDRNGPVLAFDRAVFAAFIDGVTHGEFDLRS
jgi:hypothetical protein